MSVSRSELLEHLRRTRFAPGDRERARRDAEGISAILRERYGAEVWGIGSLFDGLRPFRRDSDIDLVVRGIPKDMFFKALADAEGAAAFPVDLIPWEDANDLIRETVLERGVRL